MEITAYVCGVCGAEITAEENARGFCRGPCRGKNMWLETHREEAENRGYKAPETIVSAPETLVSTPAPEGLAKRCRDCHVVLAKPKRGPYPLLCPECKAKR